MSYPLKFRYRNYGPFDSPLYLAFREARAKEDAPPRPSVLWAAGALFLPAGKLGDFVMFAEHPDHGMVALIFTRGSEYPGRAAV